MSRRSRRAVYPTMEEAITFSLPVSIDLTRKDHVLTVEWLRGKLAEAETHSSVAKRFSGPNIRWRRLWRSLAGGVGS